MKKVSIIKNLSILLSFGAIVKTLGLFNKIILTRYLSIEGLTLYTKMVPIAGLFLTIATYSLGSTITQMVSKNVSVLPYSNRDLIVKGLITSTTLASIISIIHLISNYLICHYLLRMDILFKPFLFFIPLYYFAGYTGVLRGYFHGHNRMDIYAIGQLIEQIIRIILVFLFIKPMIEISLIKGVIAAVVTLSIGELSQNIYLIIRVLMFTSVKKKSNIKANYKELITTSSNLTSNRLIASASGFLEPIIYTYAFLMTGLAQNIGDEIYAIINGYSIPIILTTNFITASIETAILPSLTIAHKNGNKKKFNLIIYKALLLSFIPGAIVSIAYYFFPYEIMNIFYNTTNGAYFIKIMAIPSFFGYFEGVFVSALIASNNEKKLVKNTIITNSIHLILIYLLVSIPRINATGLVYSFSLVVILSTIILFIFTIKNTSFVLKLKRIIPYLLIYILSFLIIIIGIKLSINTYIIFSISVIILTISSYFISKDFLKE